VDIDTITETDALTLDLLIDKFDEVLPEYYRLNEIQSVDPPERPPDDVVETVTRQLESAKQVVFYGPPGTGKTFEAKRFAEWWVFDQSDGKPRDEQVESVTFHPSFSYEDFIEGLTAEATEEGDVQYQIEDGVLKRVAERAQRAYDQTQDSKSDSDGFGGSREAPPYVLIIDEINRGNLAQIFGEVITLLEADKRGSFEISLAHSGEQFSLPPNLYVIGTMNTADQSIALVDTALRRRFRFVDFPPNLDVIWQEYQVEARTPTDAVTQPGAAGSRREQLLGASVEAISELNTRILHAPELGKGKQLGHTYLLGHDSAIDVVDAWRYDILPQLEEYYFGQFDRLQNDLLTETGDRLIDWETEQIRSFNAESLYTALCQIARINDPVPLVDGAEVVVSDGDGTSLEAQDSWAAGEKTKEAFRERIQRNLNQQAAERVERLLDVGEDLGWVDTGRGDQYPTAQLKTDDIDPGVGVIQINQDGEIDFRWDWLSGREENSLPPQFIDEAASVFDVIDGYEHTWNPDEEEFESPTLDVAMLSDEEMDALVEGIQSFAQRAANHDE
jgi:5-methylcytosine-specific restriction protein B